jgi:hypothetical protein
MHTNRLYIFNTLRRENAYTHFFLILVVKYGDTNIHFLQMPFHTCSWFVILNTVGWSPALIERFSWGSWKHCWSYRPHYAYTEHTTLYFCVYNCRWRGVIHKRNQIGKWSFTWGKFKPSAVSHNDIQHHKTGEP